MLPATKKAIASLKEEIAARKKGQAFAGWCIIASIICIPVGFGTGNRLLALCSICWLAGSFVTASASVAVDEEKEFQEKLDSLQSLSDIADELDAQIAQSKAQKPQMTKYDAKIFFGPISMN